MTLRLRMCTASAVVLGTVASCSGAGAPVPRAALTIQIQPAGSCSVSPPEYSIGEGSFELRRNGGDNRIEDGEDGAEVSCRVAGSETFTLDARLFAAKRVNFSVKGEITASGGTVTISEWDLMSQASLSSDSCELDVRFIAEGAIWAEFTCDDFSGDRLHERGCRSQGVFVFENCSKS